MKIPFYFLWIDFDLILCLLLIFCFEAEWFLLNFIVPLCYRFSPRVHTIMLNHSSDLIKKIVNCVNDLFVYCCAGISSFYVALNWLIDWMTYGKYRKINIFLKLLQQEYRVLMNVKHTELSNSNLLQSKLFHVLLNVCYWI